MKVTTAATIPIYPILRASLPSLVCKTDKCFLFEAFFMPCGAGASSVASVGFTSDGDTLPSNKKLN